MLVLVSEAKVRSYFSWIDNCLVMMTKKKGFAHQETSKTSLNVKSSYPTPGKYPPGHFTHGATDENAPLGHNFDIQNYLQQTCWRISILPSKPFL